MVKMNDMRPLAAVLFLLLFTAAGLYAQDTLYGTISVKKNKKAVKTLTVYNYPHLNSKRKDALKTEFMKYDPAGNLILHYNYYNNTNETYDYDSANLLRNVNVFNTYLRTYMYRDSLGYDEKGRLVAKVRYSIDKFNVGRRDVTPLPNSGAINYVPEGVIFSETYRYDDEGKLVYKANKRETQFNYFTYTYDSAGNPVEEKDVSVRKRNNGTGWVNDTLVVINYTKYDDYSNPVTYVSKNSRGEVFKSTINRYDEKGRKVEAQVFDASFQLKQKFQYSYDEWGNMTGQLYADYAGVKDGKPLLSTETKIIYEYEFY
jgi:hypothetical protein